MQELLTVIVAWLAINFGLPPNTEPPRVSFVPPAEMASVRASRTGAAATAGASTTAPAPFHAIYDDRGRTIYLHERWSAGSAADVSMLVHETVHHLQNIAGLDYACAEARERPAYQAQERWLELFGKSLAGEFGLDGMTIHLRTHCMR